VTGDDIKALRKELGLSIQSLASQLKVETRTILAWESGDLFPTKRHVSALLDLTRKKDESGALPTPHSVEQAELVAQLENPELWALVVKLATDPVFFEEAQRLAKRPRN
jgi:transcriptional regulator with XRE-family HTH domain